MLSNNHNMLKLMNRLGFDSKISEEDHGTMKVSKALYQKVPALSTYWMRPRCLLLSGRSILQQA